MASDSDGELDATFSCMEQPPLIKQLRGILSEYPDNGQIIKELLQNAEDARAREVEIIYDERIINQSEDKKKPFRKFFKGPALCVKNNSMFADRDWKGIKMVASSVKEDDKLNVGRFGLGFKSVFHMTDFPCIISGERVLLIDPTRPSDQVNAEMKLKDLWRIRGMDVDAFLEALGNLGINETIINQGNYPGTVFWFPFRNETSKISSTLYDREKIMDLFSSFEHDSSEVLIFLSHIESVSLHIIATSGVINKVAGAEITENKVSIRQKRMDFVEKIKVSRYPQHSPFVCSYKMNIQSTTRDGRVEDTKWVIVHYFMGNNSSQTLQNLVADPDLGYNPLVGVAMPVTSSSSAKFEGHVFCFLPLPKEGHRLTGLPVHINGFFSLSQNRHHMKWATDDQVETKVKDKNVVWNRTLIEECLPEAYRNLFGMLLEESRRNGNTDASVEVTYKAVPDEATVLDKWKRIPKKLNSYLHQLPFLYSKSQQRYVVIKEALFATFRDLKPDMAHLQEDIAYTISRMSVAYVSTSLETFQKLEFYSRDMMKDLTPTRFADMLRQESRILQQLTRLQRLSVLAYLLSSGNYSRLRGLKLLPVASGTWSAYGTGSPVFLCGSEEEELFPEFAARMITPRPDFDENMWNHFEKMASMDTYQLKLLNKNSLKDLLNESLQLKVGTSYTITNQTQLDWLQKVWFYINRNPASIDNKIQTPIIPEMKKDRNGKIQLHPMSRLFLKGGGIPEDVCDCFRKLDVTILPHLPKWLPEDSLSHFTTVHSPKTDSMNNLLGKVWSLPGRETIVDRFNQKVSKPHKDKFVEFMATFSLYTNAIKLLRSLSIFRFGSKLFDSNNGYTSLDNISTFLAASDIPVRLPRAFVIGTQESTCCLLRNLNAVEEGRVSLVKMILTEMKRGGHYSKKEIGQFMLYFIKNFGEFEHVQSLVEIASEIPFVTTDTIKLRPKDLFNPDAPLVWNLFNGQKDKFPLFRSGMIDRTKYALKRLGLKEMNMITPNDIAESADLVSLYSHDKSKHTLCVTKSNAIFTVLNANPSMLQQHIRGNTLKSKLSQLKCIPCALERPSHYPPSLPWFPEIYSKFFCTPLEARIKDYKNECLVGSTMPLVESAFENLHADFGWKCIPPLEKVIDQLTYVKQHYKIQEKSSVLPLVNQIYEVLSTNVMKIDLDKLKTNALIWTGDGFEEPGDIVITLKASDLQNLIPYAYSIPPEFSRYETLFKTVGCHLEQSAFVLIHVLDRIQAKHIQEQPSEQYEKDCELVQKVVSKLAEKRAEIMGKDVLLPIRTNSTFNQLQFRRASECTFDKNASRYEHEEGDTSIVFVSEIIAIDVAKALGAKPLNIQILSGTEGMGVEGFGQSEKLTDRIQKLISESYVDGLSVPKELIQNADDAGATTVKFLYDERQHDNSGTMLLSKEMTHCQGPSIVVYNDATFTDSDFDNIRKLNGATKEMDANKIGRFGLGFCAVYNLTDVPSFISKNNVVIFDPQKTYLTEALEDNSPGIKIDFRRVENRKLLRLYRGQFKPFQDLFDCDVNKLQESGFPGTLFRLPLRTSAQARTSAICNVCYSSNEVLELLSKFVENAGNMLLFTQHVEHLELYHIPKGAKSVSEKVLLFRATKNSIGDSSIANHSTVLQRVTSSLSARRHFREYERFIVSAQLTPECRSLLPKLDVQEHTVSSAWVVVWETGKNESLNLSKKIKGKRAIPLSAVAVQCGDGFIRPLREAELSSLFYKTGHMFCFLPLPIKTHLKVQINGSFDVTSDRRRLITLTDDDKDNRQNKWNEFLLTDASVNAFFSLLEFFSSEKFDRVYFDLWPSDYSTEVEPFCNNFYKRILSEDRRVFYGQGKFVSFSEITFLSRNLRDHTDIGQIGFNMLSAIGEHRGKTLVDLPQHIEIGLEDVGDISLSSIKETEFLELFLKHINHIYWNGRVEERNAILVYALKSSNAKIENRLKMCSCIPVKPRGTLKKPCELVEINGKLSALFSEDDEVFLHENLRHTDLSKYLLKLGMIRDILPVPVLIERFSTIELLALYTCTRCALRRCQLLLQYLNEYKVRTSLKESNVVKEAVANLYILPVLQRPNGWCFSWKGDVANGQNDEEIKHFSHTTCCKVHTKEGLRKLTLGMTRSLFSEGLHKAGATVISVVDKTLLKGNEFTFHDTVFDILGIQSSMPSNVIIKHMTVLSYEYINVDKQFEQLQSIFDFVNRMLQSMITSSQNDMNRQTVVTELQKLKDIPIILVGKTLYVPNSVAFEINQECPPHLVRLPEIDAITKKELFLELGVKQRFTASNIIEVLKEKKAFWMNEPCAEIDLIVKLLENLCLCCENEVLENDENVVSPDRLGYLYPMHDLVIANDKFESDVLMHVIHKSIPPAIAEILGAKHKQRKCFEEITTWFGEPFGQNEKLVTRINNILNAYPCDSSIMKELLQNADDAQASQIHFIKDFRMHPKERIFDEKCASFQGPSLCVFNDSYFTEQDLRGIHDLGEGSKGQDPTKTGQYGVGFNSVYHLTDTPSFMSRGPGLPDEGLLIIFDPTCNHLPGVKREEPGLKCKVKEVQTNFPDILAGFTSSDSLFEGNKGTLFRFPLRSSESEISKYAHSDTTITNILEEMSKDMLESLLFVKNVECIKVSNVSTGEFVEEYSVKSVIADADKERRTHFFQEVEKICKDFKNDKSSILTIEPLEVSYKMTLVDTREMNETFIVVQRFGLWDQQDISDTVEQAFQNNDLGCLPLGGVAYRMTEHFPKKSVQALASGNHLRVSHRETLEEQNQLDTKSRKRSKLFCFLPIPGDTNLPVHVNGHFALDNARRVMSKDGFKKDWNQCLLKNVVVPAYIQCITYWRDSVSDKLTTANNWRLVNQISELYHSIFPFTESNNDTFCKFLIASLYESMIKRKQCLFPTIKVRNESDRGNQPSTTANDETFQCEWVPLALESDSSNGHFNTLENANMFPFGIDSTLKNMWALASVLKNIGMKIIHTPIIVKKAIIDCKAGIPACTSPDAVVSFISTCTNDGNGQCKISLLESNIETTLIQTVTNVILVVRFIKESSSFSQYLPHLPIRLTAAKVLGTFTKEAPMYSSEFCSMFPNSQDSFIHCDMLNVYPTDILKEEGYIKDFTKESFIQLIPEIYKRHLYQVEPMVSWERGREVFPSVKWISSFWKFICSISKESKEGPTFIENVEYFSDWAFIPAVMEDRGVLLKISQAFMIVDVISFIENKDLQKSLAMFKPLKLDKTVFLKKTTSSFTFTLDTTFSKVKSLGTSVRKPERLLEFLLFQTSLARPPPFSQDDAVCLLKHFSNKVYESCFASYPMLKTELMRLPFFVTLTNSTVSLQSARDIFVIPPKMPVAGVDTLSNRTGVILLKENRELHNLYTFLGLSDMTVSSLYANYLLPQMSYIPRNVWLQHIKFLRDFVLVYGNLQEPDQKKMINLLRNMAFIETENGPKRCSELFAHSNADFQKLCDEREFLPQEFQCDEWKHLLEALGTHFVLTDDLLLEFARRIESRGSTDRSVKLRSGTLMECFILRLSQWNSETLKRLAKIRFILPIDLKPVYRHVFPPKDDGLVCMYNSVEAKHAELCWSTLHILPFSIESHYHKSIERCYHKDLEIHTKPPLLDVLKHCQNVSTKMREKIIKDPAAMKHLMYMWYSFLSKNAENPLTKKMLIDFPIIHLPYKRKMVKANDVVIELASNEAVEPYLFRAPVEYGSFFKLFQLLGTSKEVQCYHYMHILTSIAIEAGNKELSVTELHAAGKTISLLYKSLATLQTQKEFLEYKLHLPNLNKVMCESTELVVVDNHTFKERMTQVKTINYFIGFQELELKDIDPNIFLHYLPKEIRPKALTQIVEEAFDEDLVILNNSPLASKICLFIHSEEFVRGICRMVKQHKAELFNLAKDVNSIKQAILKINVFEVEELQTHLLYQGNIVMDSNRQGVCFCEKKDDLVNVYFNLPERDDFMALVCNPYGLSEVIREYIGLPHESIMIITDILRMLDDNPDKISTKLDSFSYPPLDCDIDLNAFSVFPWPGTYVEKKFHPFLEQSLESFHKEEFLSIAMELEDEGIDTNVNDGMEVIPIFIYVHIKEEIHIDNNVQDRDNLSLVKMMYLVDAGDTEAVEVPGYRLYRFVRPKRSSNEATIYTGKTPLSFLPFDENCKRIREQLLDAWTLPEAERKRVIRRLLFHWHPDRNRGSEENASRLFNYIKLSVLRLEETGSLGEEDETDGQPPDFSHSNYSSMYGNLNRRANTWARAYYDNLDDYNMTNKSGNYTHRDPFRSEVRDLNEARRWIKQAKKDFQAASAYLEESEDKVSFNWICYMCHQASEKALKAACYAKNANDVSLKDHSLTQPARLLTDSLMDLARRMEAHLGYHTRMRYPNAVNRPQVPAEIYTKDHAETAMGIAKEIVDASSLLIE